MANVINSTSAIIPAGGAAAGQNNPRVAAGELQFESNVNVLKMSIECVDNVARELISNLNNDFSVNIIHLIRTIRSSFAEPRDAERVLAQYLVPIKGAVTNANLASVNQRAGGANYVAGAANMVPNWQRNVEPLPKLYTVVSPNRVIVGYKLNIGRLTFNQAVSLLIGAPKFVLNSCVFVDNKNKVNKFSNLKEIMNYFLHIRIPFFNRYLALEKAKEQNMTDMIRRYQRSLQGNENQQVQVVTVTVVQYSHMLSFAASENEAFVETASEQLIGRVGIKKPNDDQNVYGYSVGGTHQAPTFVWIANTAAPDPRRANGYYDTKPSSQFVDPQAADYDWFSSQAANYGDYNAMTGVGGVANNLALNGQLGLAGITTAQLQAIWHTLDVRGKVVNDVPVRSFRV